MGISVEEGRGCARARECFPSVCVSISVNLNQSVYVNLSLHNYSPCRKLLLSITRVRQPIRTVIKMSILRKKEEKKKIDDHCVFLIS